MSKKSKKQKKSNDINTYLAAGLVIAVAIAAYFTFTVPTTTTEQPTDAREVTVQFLGADCADCVDLSAAIDFLEQQDLTITKIENLSTEASTSLAEQYGITKLPSIIITGDTDGLTIENFDAKEDAIVFTQTPPPYYDIETGELKGKVSLTILDDETCADCFDMDPILSQLEQVGITIASQERLDRTSTQGQALIAKYDIETVPTLIFSEDVGEYDVIKQIWAEAGSIEDDGAYVLRIANPPYVNLSTGETRGIVDITYLADENCTDCFDPTVLNTIFGESFAMAFGEEKTVDIASTQGEYLIRKHNITMVPTAILSPEASVYPNFAQAWTQVGDISEGSYVFTAVPLLEAFFKQTQQADSITYKDLSTGETVNTAETE